MKKQAVTAFLFSFIFLFTSLLTGGERSPNALNTEWQILSDKTIQNFDQLAAVSPDQWKEIVLPAYSMVQNQDDIFWYRTQVRIPHLQKGERLFLCFDGVKFDAKIWLDGRFYGGYSGGSEPFRIDLTDAAIQNENSDQNKRTDTAFNKNKTRNNTESAPNSALQTLVVRVRAAAAIAKEKPGPSKKGGRPAEAFVNSVMWPVGSQGFSKIGIWEPVRFEIRNSVDLTDLFIQTSVAHQTIQIDGQLKNSSTEKKDLEIQTRVVPWRGSETVLAFEPVRLELNTAEKSFHLKKIWTTPRYWSPRDPYLYDLELTVIDRITGQKILVKRERFGFREFTAQGDLFYLNGIPMHALGTASHPNNVLENGESKSLALTAFQKIREANINFVRLHANYWPKAFVETADEAGMPLILETGFFCWVRSYAITDPFFWKNFDVHVHEFQKKHRNNPSFCMFSLCNEILHCGGKQIEPNVEYYLAQAGSKAKRFDPTRPILFDGDMDPKLTDNVSQKSKTEELKTGPASFLSGVADVVNSHYPQDFSGTVDGCEDLDWPEAAWWIGHGKKLACYPREFYQWDRKKPLYFGEYLHIQHYVDSRNYSLVLGDQAGQGSFETAMGLAKAKTWAMQIPAYRAEGVSGQCPWVITEPGVAPIVNGSPNPRYQTVKDAYEPVCVVLKPVNKFCKPDSNKKLDLYLLNDTDAVRNLDLVIRLEQKGKNVYQKNINSVMLDPAGRKMITADLDLSNVTDGEFTVRLILTHQGIGKIDWTKTGALLPNHDRYFLKDGKIERSFTLVKTRSDFWRDPRSNSNKPADMIKIGLIGDQTAAVSQIILMLGDKPEIRKINSVADPKILDDLDGLIIGKNRLSALFSDQESFEVGADDNPADNLSKFLKHGKIIILEQDNYPNGFLPIELEARTISHYENNAWTKRWSCPKPFHLKPDAGCFEPICRIGGPKGFEYAAVLKYENLLLSQLPTETDLLENPAVQLDLAQAVRQLFNRPKQKSLSVIDSSNAVQKTLDRIGVVYTDRTNIIKANPNGNNLKFHSNTGDTEIVLINANEKISFKPGINQTAVLCGLDTINLKNWSNILPTGFSLSKNDGPVSFLSEGTVNNGSSSIGIDKIKTASNESFRFYDGPISNLRWLGDRKDLPFRWKTPIQNIANFAAVPFIVDESRINEYPPIPFTRFKANNPKAKFGKEYLTSSVNVVLNTEITAAPDHYYLELDAHGTVLWNECSKVRIQIDGKESGILELDPKFSKKRVPVVIRKSPALLEICYYNDQWDPVTRIDRNFWFRSARLIPAKDLDSFASPFLPPVCAAFNTNWRLDNIKWFCPEYSASGPLFYIADLLRKNGIEFKVPFGGLKIAGTKFNYDSKKYRPVWKEPNVLSFGSNGTISQKVVFGKEGRYKFSLRAGGTAVDDIYPEIHLLINGKKAGVFHLNGLERNEIAITAAVGKGEQIIALQFTNDLYRPSNRPDVPNQDRNSQIEYLRIEPTK